ncbi:hypothetical protein [Armatimonas sp.]|uniref:hypothetical protein n=1 Tax=Armatimonas sp. TaxID=1872638 RepID=UPI00286C65A9|nr:hypothetical protein [Armatimonas sp.]
MDSHLTIEELLPPHFVAPPVLAPLTVLRQVALLLGERTRGAVVGEVILEAKQDQGSVPAAVFMLCAPALADYRFPLFQIEVGARAYPVRLKSRVFAELSGDPYLDDSDRVFLYCIQATGGQPLSCDCRSEADFFRLLRTLFYSKITERLIGNLIAQSTTILDLNQTSLDKILPVIDTTEPTTDTTEPTTDTTEPTTDTTEPTTDTTEPTTDTNKVSSSPRKRRIKANEK